MMDQDEARAVLARTIAVSSMEGERMSVPASVVIDAMLAFAAEARADQKERDARVAEDRHEQWRMPHPDEAKPGEVCCDVSACRDIAAAIRGQP